MSWGTLPAMGISLRRKIDGITRETRVMWWNWEGTVAGLGLAQQAWLSLIASWGRREVGRGPPQEECSFKWNRQQSLSGLEVRTNSPYCH